MAPGGDSAAQSPTEILRVIKIENEMGWACSTYGGEEWNIQGFGGESWGKRLLGRPRRRLEDNIKKYIFRWDVRVWTGSSWLRIGTGVGHL